MKNILIIPAMTLALCSTGLYAQEKPQPKNLNAPMDMNKDLFPEAKKIKTFTAQRSTVNKHVADLEPVNERKATAAKPVVVKAFPNPFTTELSISVNENPGDAVYEGVLYDLQGKKVFSQDLGSKNTQLNMQHVNAGIYVLHVLKNGHTILQEKVVKQ
jgi:hypothetical protein